MPANDFWSGIIRTSAAGSEKVPVSHEVAETEIGNFDIEIGIQQEVLRLEIAMNDFLKMAIFDTGYNLMEEIPRFVGGKAAFGNNVVEEFSPGHIFVDEEYIGGGIDDFVEADNVWVCAEVKDINFALDFFFHSELFNFSFVEDLDCHFVSCDCMCCKFYL